MKTQSNRAAIIVISIIVALFVVGGVVATLMLPFMRMTAVTGVIEAPMMGESFGGGAVATSAPGYDMMYDGYAEEAALSARGLTSMPPQPYPSGGATAAEVDQKIIKTSYLDLVVTDVGESVSKITALASGNGGFVQDSSVSEREDGTHYGSITIRIPANTFETVSADVKKLATTVRTESANGQDVTEQYSDLELQLTNARAENAQYLEILKKATRIEDILAVQQYVSQTEQRIQSLEGQLKYYDNVTTYSTISISLSEEPTVRLPTKEFRPLDSAREAVQALIALAQGLGVFLIWLVIVGGGVFIPVAILVAIFVKIILLLVKKFLK